MKRIHAVAVLVVVFIGAILYLGYLKSPGSQRTSTTEEKKYVGAWGDVELKDVATGSVFRIRDFKGKPVVLESFAVWCKTCLQQQREISTLKGEQGSAIVHISLDTDANEDEGKVMTHYRKYGFDWIFAVAPIEVMRALIDDYGLQIVNAPAAPVVIICEDQSTKFLRDGVKSADELLSEIKKSC